MVKSLEIAMHSGTSEEWQVMSTHGVPKPPIQCNPCSWSIIPMPPNVEVTAQILYPRRQEIPEITLSPLFSRTIASIPPSSVPLNLQIQPSSPPIYAQLPSPFQDTEVSKVSPKAEGPPACSMLELAKVTLKTFPPSPTMMAVSSLGWNDESRSE